MNVFLLPYKEDDELYRMFGLYALLITIMHRPTARYW